MGFQHVENWGVGGVGGEGESEFTLHKPERYEGIIVLPFA